MQVVRTKIETILQESFEPLRLQIDDRSSEHRHHPAMKGVANDETHFFVTIVSDYFLGLDRVQRHRSVHMALQHLLEDDIHALSLSCLTESEYASNNNNASYIAR